MLKGTKIYINEDCPKEIIEQRKQLIKHMKNATEKGYMLHYNKLFINEQLWSLEQLERSTRMIKETLKYRQMDFMKWKITVLKRFKMNLAAQKTNKEEKTLKDSYNDLSNENDIDGCRKEIFKNPKIGKNKVRSKKMK